MKPLCGRGGAFWIWLALCIAFSMPFILPAPSFMSAATSITLLRAELFGGDHATVVAGNSVLIHVSKCDADATSIPRLLEEDLKTPVWNAGFSGQIFDESIGFASQPLRWRKVDNAVIYLSAFATQYRFQSDLATVAYFRLYSGEFRSTSIGERLQHSPVMSPVFSPIALPFTYRGRSYPDYEGITRQYFLRELYAMRCPETIGQDRAFIEANFWNAFDRTDIDPAYVDDLAALSVQAERARKKFLVVLLPVDVDDMGSLNHQLAEDVRARLKRMNNTLRARHIHVLDMTTALPASAFADRWAAGVHLLTVGQRAVAAQTAAALRSYRLGR